MTQRTISNLRVTTTERFPTWHVHDRRSAHRSSSSRDTLMMTKVGGGRFTDVCDEIVGIAINMSVGTRVKLAEQAMS
jgi:hypothetical protein